MLPNGIASVRNINNGLLIMYLTELLLFCSHLQHFRHLLQQILLELELIGIFQFETISNFCLSLPLIGVVNCPGTPPPWPALARATL